MAKIFNRQAPGFAKSSDFLTKYDELLKKNKQSSTMQGFDTSSSPSFLLEGKPVQDASGVGQSAAYQASKNFVTPETIAQGAPDEGQQLLEVLLGLDTSQLSPEQIQTRDMIIDMFGQGQIEKGLQNTGKFESPETINDSDFDVNSTSTAPSPNTGPASPAIFPQAKPQGYQQSSFIGPIRKQVPGQGYDSKADALQSLDARAQGMSEEEYKQALEEINAMPSVPQSYNESPEYLGGLVRQISNFNPQLGDTTATKYINARESAVSNLESLANKSGEVLGTASSVADAGNRYATVLQDEVNMLEKQLEEKRAQLADPRNASVTRALNQFKQTGTYEDPNYQPDNFTIPDYKAPEPTTRQNAGNAIDQIGTAFKLPELGLSELVAGGNTTNSLLDKVKSAVVKPAYAAEPQAGQGLQQIRQEFSGAGIQGRPAPQDMGQQRAVGGTGAQPAGVLPTGSLVNQPQPGSAPQPGQFSAGTPANQTFSSGTTGTRSNATTSVSSMSTPSRSTVSAASSAMSKPAAKSVSTPARVATPVARPTSTPAMSKPAPIPVSAPARPMTPAQPQRQPAQQSQQAQQSVFQKIISALFGRR